ncbi:MAG: TrbI/VirB10 family protein, partial [Alphaproteobacteria bacterium]
LGNDGTELCRITIMSTQDEDSAAVKTFAGRAVYGPDGKLLGYVGEDGLVRDANGNVIGRVMPDGTVVDMAGNVIGQAAPAKEMVGRAVYGPDGKLLGYVGEDGLVRDASGRVIGRMLPDGTVVDLAGNVIGQAAPAKEMVGRAVYGPDGKLLGYVGEDGLVRDANGNVIGRVMPDGTVVDLNGNPIGRVSATESVRAAIGRDGKFLGMIQPDGTLRDKDGRVIGRVLPDGTVVDLNGNVIGSVMEGEPVRDESGNIIGVIMPDGRVMSLNGVQIGRIDAEGNIVDGDGNLIGTWKGGKFVAQGETLKPRFIFDKNGKKIGIVLTDGTVVNESGDIIGVMNENGEAIGFNGEILGTDYIPGQDGSPEGPSDEQKKKTSKGGNIAVPGAFDPAAYGQYRGQNLGAGGGVGRGERYDPVRMARLQAMQAARRRAIGVGVVGVVKSPQQIESERLSGIKKSKGWEAQGIEKNISSYRVDMDRMILADKAIPAVLVRSLDSRFPDVPVSAIVERNIYSESGRKIIIPAGSRLIGELAKGDANSVGAALATKMEIAWTRLIRPDGAAFFFKEKGSSGDAQGRGGVSAYLDLQLLRRFGTPLLESVVTSAILYSVASDEKPVISDNGEVALSERQEAAKDARSKFGDDMDQVFQSIFSQTSKMAVVSYVPSGTRITVYAKEDLWLRSEDDPSEADMKKMGGEGLLDEKDPNLERFDNGQGTGVSGRGASQGGGAGTGTGVPQDPNAPPPAAYSPEQLQQQQQMYYGYGQPGAPMPGGAQPQSSGNKLLSPSSSQQQYQAYPPPTYYQQPTQGNALLSSGNKTGAAPLPAAATPSTTQEKEEDPVPELF